MPDAGRDTTPTCPACGFVLSSIHGNEWWCERCPWDGTEADRAGRQTTVVVDAETLRLLVSLARGYTQSRGQFIDRDGVLLAAEAALQHAEDEEASRG